MSRLIRLTEKDSNLLKELVKMEFDFRKYRRAEHFFRVLNVTYSTIYDESGKESDIIEITVYFLDSSNEKKFNHYLIDRDVWYKEFNAYAEIALYEDDDEEEEVEIVELPF